MTTSLRDPVPFARGPAMPNRFMLAPLTNKQSHEDGTLSQDEFHWLAMRAAGGFGLTMTAAAQVAPDGRCFAGQIGIFSDDHIPALARLAAAINSHGGLSSVQLHHGGRRALPELINGQPICPWEDAKLGAREMTTADVERLIESYVAAALRAERAGFHGAELHGAHGYLIAQFLDAENVRTDGYGGRFENRARFLLTIVEGIRERTRPDFQLGVRLSPERYGVTITEAKRLAEQLMSSGQIDYLDMSLWDVFKLPADPEHGDKPLIAHFADLPRGRARLGVAGQIRDAATAQACIDAGADYVLIGRGAILHHDFPRRAAADPGFACVSQPVTRDYLRCEGLGEPFIDYMDTQWNDFVAD